MSFRASFILARLHLPLLTLPWILLSLFHSRVGHLNIFKFQIMVPRFSILSSIKCESCQLGKHTRVSFPKCLDQLTKSPFELVHTNVWSPSRNESTLGFQYFVTLIDDYSHYTWLFLMKTRAKLFSIFQKFHVEVRTQFNTSIRILRSDNAKEYLMDHSPLFCPHMGFFISPLTLTLLNIMEWLSARTIIWLKPLALSYSIIRFLNVLWGDATLAACYLINRMPSSVLHDKIPQPILFPNQPLFYLPPRVFTCVCFVHILTPGQDKLTTKSMKCVFLSYSQLQRRYRWYSPDTHRYFVSVNVTFFENSSMFPITHFPSSDVISLSPSLSHPGYLTCTSSYSTSTIVGLYSSPVY